MTADLNRETNARIERLLASFRAQIYAMLVRPRGGEVRAVAKVVAGRLMMHVEPPFLYPDDESLDTPTTLTVPSCPIEPRPQGLGDTPGEKT